MKKLLCFSLVFLLSISAVGCAQCTSDTAEAFTKPLVSEESPIRNYYEINGVMRDIGDYTGAEEMFLMDYYKNRLPVTGIPANKVFVYDAGELTEEVLENRIGTLIIERCIGIVTDKENGDGQILNYDNDRYYIAYRNDTCEELNLRNGTVLASYMVYNPSNNYIDDIMERYDFVVCREYED